MLKITSILRYFWLDFNDFIIGYITFIILSVLITYLLIRWRNSSWLKIIIVNLVFFIFLLVNLFYALEIYYRYIFDSTDNILQMKTTQRWIQRHVRINAFSFRSDHFFREKDPKELRLSVVGDSIAYGYGVKDENDRFSNLLEQKLTQTCSSKGSAVKIYNISKPGMNTSEEKTAIRQYAHEYLTDAVILAYYLNDTRSNRTPLHTDICYNRIFQYQKHPFWNFLLGKSYAVEYLYVRAYSLLRASQYTSRCWTGTELDAYYDPEIWIRHLKDLKDIIEYTRKENMGLAVAIFPMIKDLNTTYPARLIHDRLGKFLKENDVMTIDLLPVYEKYPPEKLMVSSQDFHPNEFAHKLAFEAIYEQIKNESWVQCKMDQ